MRMTSTRAVEAKKGKARPWFEDEHVAPQKKSCCEGLSGRCKFEVVSGLLIWAVRDPLCLTGQGDCCVEATSTGAIEAEKGKAACGSTPVVSTLLHKLISKLYFKFLFSGLSLADVSSG